MSTIFNIRRPEAAARLPRRSLIIGALVVVLGNRGRCRRLALYKKLTTNTVIAYFPRSLALYPGDKVQIMGVQVGAIDEIEPAGDKMKVTFHYDKQVQGAGQRHRVDPQPQPGGVADIQLSPPYTGGPVMKNGAVIPIDRTQVPVE